MHLGPRRLRFIGSHRLRKLCRVRTKILLVNASGLVDNKSHHTGGAVVDRIGDKGKSRCHLPIDEIVLGSARRMWSLAGEDPKHIPIERNMLANVVGWKILASVSDERIDRAIELIASSVPVQTIVAAFIADQFLCELLWLVNWRAREILLLGFNQFAARIHCGNFIPPDAEENVLVFHCVVVELHQASIDQHGSRNRTLYAP